MTAKFTVRSETDFIALAPVVLGFQPTNSLVMMTVDNFHARVDLPETDDDIGQVVNALLSPCQKHGVKRVAFLVYGQGNHRKLGAALLDSFGKAGIELLAALQVHEEKYRQLGGRWKPFDIASHPMTLEAGYLDLAPRYQSRDDLARWVKPSGEVWTGEPTGAFSRLLRDGLEGVVSSLSLETAKEASALWVSVLRCLQPDSEHVSDVSIVVAFAAWLSGDGAMAWVALDHADEASTWHLLLSTALEQAVNPAEWERVRSDG